jgi:hypothetical protein
MKTTSLTFPETFAMTLEVLEALEVTSARLVRKLRLAAQPGAAQDAGAIEYDSWVARSPGELGYDSWH